MNGVFWLLLRYSAVNLRRHMPVRQAGAETDSSFPVCDSRWQSMSPINRAPKHELLEGAHAVNETPCVV